MLDWVLCLKEWAFSLFHPHLIIVMLIVVVINIVIFYSDPSWFN